MVNSSMLVTSQIKLLNCLTKSFLLRFKQWQDGVCKGKNSLFTGWTGCSRNVLEKKKKKRKKKRKCLFGGTVPLKTNQYFFFFEPNVLCLGKEKKKHHLRSFLILYTLPSVTIFSKLFSIHFLWCWPGEFKASKVGNYVLYSHDVNEWFNSITNC